MRKTKRNRTPKEERKDAPIAKYVEVKTKSRAGVKHIKYVLKLPENPVGFNHNSRRQLDAMDKREKEGREYYMTNSKGKRMYVKKGKKVKPTKHTPKGTKPIKKPKKVYGKK